MLIRSLPRRSAVLGASILAGGTILSGCDSSNLQSAGPLVPASDGQFTSPIKVSVTDGTSGLEHTADNKTFWWLTAAGATVEVSNIAASTSQVVLTAVATTPPCASSLDLVVDQPGSAAKQLHVGVGGTPISVRLQVPPGQTSTLKISVLTAGCTVPGDPRRFFAALNDLRAAPEN